MKIIKKIDSEISGLDMPPQSREDFKNYQPYAQ